MNLCAHISVLPPACDGLDGNLSDGTGTRQCLRSASSTSATEAFDGPVLCQHPSFPVGKAEKDQLRASRV